MDRIKFNLESDAFHDRDEIPKEYTAEGSNVSPPLRWTGVPPSTRELVLVCEDPDAVKNPPFIHWMVYKIPIDSTGFQKGVPRHESLVSHGGILQGKNSTGETGYYGPQPPPGTGEHRYYFRLLALDSEIDLKPGATYGELFNAIIGRVDGEAKLVGRYGSIAERLIAHKLPEDRSSS